MKNDGKQGTEVIYVRGNHDDFYDILAPMTFYNVKIVKDFIHESHGKRHYVTHGETLHCDKLKGNVKAQI